jgi:hypothetical protein
MSTEIDTAPALTESQARALFEKEFVPHLDAMYNFALRLTNDEDDAHDLVQDTCMRAFRFIGSFEPGTYAKAWLFRILKNNFIASFDLDAVRSACSRCFNVSHPPRPTGCSHFVGYRIPANGNGDIFCGSRPSPKFNTGFLLEHHV